MTNIISEKDLKAHLSFTNLKIVNNTLGSGYPLKIQLSDSKTTREMFDLCSIFRFSDSFKDNCSQFQRLQKHVDQFDFPAPFPCPSESTAVAGVENRFHLIMKDLTIAVLDALTVALFGSNAPESLSVLSTNDENTTANLTPNLTVGTSSSSSSNTNNAGHIPSCFNYDDSGNCSLLSLSPVAVTEGVDLSLCSLFHYHADGGEGVAQHVDMDLLTFVYSPGDTALVDKDGKSLNLTEDEIAVFVGSAVTRATLESSLELYLAKIVLKEGKDKFTATSLPVPSTIRAVKNSLQDRYALEYHARGYSNARVDCRRFIGSTPSTEGQVAVNDVYTLGEFYKRFEDSSPRGINVPSTCSACAAVTVSTAISRGRNKRPEEVVLVDLRDKDSDSAPPYFMGTLQIYVLEADGQVTCFIMYKYVDFTRLYKYYESKLAQKRTPGQNLVLRMYDSPEEDICISLSPALYGIEDYTILTITTEQNTADSFAVITAEIVADSEVSTRSTVFESEEESPPADSDSDSDSDSDNGLLDQEEEDEEGEEEGEEDESNKALRFPLSSEVSSSSNDTADENCSELLENEWLLSNNAAPAAGAIAALSTRFLAVRSTASSAASVSSSSSSSSSSSGSSNSSTSSGTEDRIVANNINISKKRSCTNLYSGSKMSSSEVAFGAGSAYQDMIRRCGRNRKTFDMAVRNGPPLRLVRGPAV